VPGIRRKRRLKRDTPGKFPSAEETGELGPHRPPCRADNSDGPRVACRKSNSNTGHGLPCNTGGEKLLQRLIGEEPVGMTFIGPSYNMDGSGGKAGKFNTTMKPEKEFGSRIAISV